MLHCMKREFLEVHHTVLCWKYADIYGVFTSYDEAKKCIRMCTNEKDEMIIYKTGLNKIIHPYYLNITENIV